MAAQPLKLDVGHGEWVELILEEVGLGLGLGSVFGLGLGLVLRQVYVPFKGEDRREELHLSHCVLAARALDGLDPVSK